MLTMATVSTQPPSGFVTANKPLPHAEHIFATKSAASGNAEQQVRLFTERIGPIAHMRQVHGDRLAYADGPGLVEEADAIFTDKRGLWLAVKSADCLPVLISSERCVAAVHAGWRGLQNEILPNTLQFLMDDFGLSPNELFIHVGPHIGVDNYQVGDEFSALFSNQSLITVNNKLHLDLGAVVREQVQQVGVPDLNITDVNLCTYTEEERFHSYRRAKQNGEVKEGNISVQLSLVRRPDTSI